MTAERRYTRRVQRSWPAAEALIDIYCQQGRAALRETIDDLRRVVHDADTDVLAVNLAVGLAASMGITPNAYLMHGFTVTHTITGATVAPEDAPPVAVATVRMIVALANADVLAARDVFEAFRTAHPDLVTDLLADAVVKVHDHMKEDDLP